MDFCCLRFLSRRLKHWLTAFVVNASWRWEFKTMLPTLRQRWASFSSPTWLMVADLNGHRSCYSFSSWCLAEVPNVQRSWCHRSLRFQSRCVKLWGFSLTTGSDRSYCISGRITTFLMSGLLTRLFVVWPCLSHLPIGKVPFTDTEDICSVVYLLEPRRSVIVVKSYPDRMAKILLKLFCQSLTRPTRKLRPHQSWAWPSVSWICRIMLSDSSINRGSSVVTFVRYSYLVDHEVGIPNATSTLGDSWVFLGPTDCWDTICFPDGL